ncbi:MAG: type I glyceraldehyde-3-phosphate dehydrogenase [Anaerolineae bacterium]|nr:type I glyceraldehyde-3-phosphate dehydrogenase [Anaerolineae bacterium]
MAKVAINGLGRIGRATLKLLMDTPELELVAVNDIGSVENLAYLIQYDSIYGPYRKSVEVHEGNLVIDGHTIAYLSERDPANLPWGKLGVDLVFESTGIFTKNEEAQKHITAGARLVIISGPSNSVEVPTIVYGVNDTSEENAIISTASCTTNNITPVIEIMGRHFGVAKALMTTVHAYTATQMLVDAPGGKKDMRRGRAAAANIVPSSTGAAIATTKALPQHKGNFDGVALRVPVTVGSIADTVMLLMRKVTVEEVNEAFRKEAASPRYKDVIRVTEDAIVSADIIGDPHAAIISLDLTQVVGGDLVKVMSWYDNEWGYTNQMIRQAKRLLTPA